MDEIVPSAPILTKLDLEVASSEFMQVTFTREESRRPAKPQAAISRRNGRALQGSGHPGPGGDNPGH
jgi:hypothetical protein